jgi:branched-chain amino acid transport system ATP-binding protein
MMSEAAHFLDVDRVNAFYDEAHILHDISLEVQREGESVALLGRNGAGKTTTLRSILGLTPARAGTITFKGRESTRWPSDDIANLGIGWVPDNRRIFPTLTVQQNLEIARKKGGGVHPEWDLVRVYSHFPVLKNLAKNKGENLSGGEQQMLSIARTLMGNPELILLDEPSEGLAPLIVREVMEIIRELSDTNIAIILVEQNAVLALRICSRVYVLDDGRNVYEGTAEELTANDALKQELLGV